MIEAGARLGRFVIGAQLGEGGMGTVYEARDPELGRAVAIKLLRDDRGDPTRLLREAQALATLSHPNVVAVYELGAHDGEVFIAMELIDGESLDRHLAAAPRTWREIVGLFVQAGRGLAAVHARELVHRDFKPSNLLIDADGRVRVSDFGLARRERAGDAGEAGDSGEVSLGGDDRVTVDDRGGAAASSTTPVPEHGLLGSPLTAAGVVIGTPRYMAPEQHAGGAITRRADQFAFCVALWEALYGEHPFAGDDREALTAAVRAGQRRPVPRGRDVPPAIERALARGLAVEPDARWPSMGALLDALAPPSHRRRTFALGAAAVALAGGALVVAWRMQERAPAPPRFDCAASAGAIDATWTPAAKAGVTRGFAALPMPWATGVGAGAIAGLDRWADRWRAVRIDACHATHTRGEQSALLLDRRSACLDGQLAAFRALTVALSPPEAATADRALLAIDLLPGPETCNAARLADAAAPAASPETVQAIDAAKAALDLRRPDAVALADAAVAAADRTGDDSLRAQALLVHAGVIFAQDPPRAQTELADALALAARVRDAALEADIVLRTLRIASALRAVDRIDALLPIARAAIARAGEPEPLVRALAGTEALADLALGRLDDARVACDRAIALADHVAARGTALECGCMIPVRARDVAGSVTGCERSYRAQLADLGPDNPAVFDARTNYSIALNRAGRPEDALVLAADNVAHAGAMFGPDSVKIASALQNRAAIEDRLGRTADSRRSLEDALAIVDKLGAPAATMRGGLLVELSDRVLDLGDRAAALQYAERGLAEAERTLAPDDPDRPVMMLRVAHVIASDPARHARAAALYEEIVTLAEQHPGAVLGSALAERASFLGRTCKQPRVGLPIAERAVTELDRGGGDPRSLGRTLVLVGELALDGGQRDQARAALTRARTVLAAVGDDLAEVDALLARL